MKPIAQAQPNKDNIIRIATEPEEIYATKYLDIIKC